MEPHKCERKIGPMWEVATDEYGNIYCLGCFAKLSDSEIHSSVLAQINKKRGKTEK